MGHHDGHCGGGREAGQAGGHRDHEHGEGHGGAHDEAHGRRERGHGGPEGTEFLQLEISQMLYGDAREAARGAVGDLLREAIRERLRQRVGDRLRAIGVLVADELADELETNIAIEQRIDAQRRRKQDVADKLRAIFEPAQRPDAATASTPTPPDED